MRADRPVESALPNPHGQHKTQGPMESFFSRYKNALVLIAVLVAQLLALAVQVKRPAPGSPDQEGVSLIRYVVVSVVTPPERWIHNFGRGVRGLWYGYMDLVHVRQQDAVLK